VLTNAAPLSIRLRFCHHILMRSEILALFGCIALLSPMASAQPTLREAISPAGLGHGTAIAPGSLVSIFGSGLAKGLSIADSVTLSTTLGDVDSVTIGGVAAPLLFVSDGQINAQASWSTGQGKVDVVVTRGGVPSQPVSIQVNQFAPALYTFSPGGLQAIAVNADGSVTAPAGAFAGITSHPATAGDTVILYATGLGPVDPSIADGAVPGDTRRQTTTTPKVLIDGASAQVSFSGLSPQFAGVYQLTMVVPSGVTTGKSVPVQVQIGDTTGADPATIAVQ
jgi:uncharacterized protein (TIGR03437 family)